MNPFFARFYLAAWCAAIALAAMQVLRNPRAYGFISRDYLRSLTVPWKLVTFTLAAGFFILAAPYVGDPTWDRIDGATMSILTYLTAPWAIGTLARTIKYRDARRTAYVAIVLWLTSASWNYDGYLYMRDGRYPGSWASNLWASCVVYAAAGLMWSLTYVPERGVVFDFMTPAWLATERVHSRKIVLFAFVGMIFAVIAMAPFALEIWRQLH